MDPLRQKVLKPSKKNLGFFLKVTPWVCELWHFESRASPSHSVIGSEQWANRILKFILQPLNSNRQGSQPARRHLSSPRDARKIARAYRVFQKVEIYFIQRTVLYYDIMSCLHFSAKMSILTQTAHTFNAIPTILPMVFFTKTEQTILTAAWNHKGPWTAKGLLRKENSNWRKFTPTSNHLMRLW